MIAYVSGKIVEKYESSVIVDVRGVGYEVIVSTADYEKINVDDSVKFKTYHHIREQSQELFGFTSLSAKRLFELLITVQGIGPKAAMSILSISESEAVRAAISNSDLAYISQASGVGRKSAERIIVDLKDKVGLVSMNYSVSNTELSSVGGDEALEALMALGYSLNDASRSLVGIPLDLPTSQRVSMALKSQ